ncbi:MAG: glycosyltransferase family 4 protein [Acidobacteriota bacterium]
MNILFIDQFHTIGGGQRSLVELLPLVRRRGWTARVALPGPGALRTKIESEGFAVDSIPCSEYSAGRKGLSDLGRYLGEAGTMAAALSRLVAAHRIDLLYVNGPRPLPAAAWVGRAKSIPLVFHCHHRICQPLAARLTGEALRWSRARVIACCRFAGEPLGGYVPAERFGIIYNGVPRPAWRRRARDPVQAWNIGVIGRVEPEKGQMEFVAAARILSEECGNCRFTVAGAPLFSGPEYFERVKEASRDLPIEFSGWQDDIGATFSRLDLLVVPSSDIDSTPRVVIEAFSGGVPVVAFPAGGIPEILRDGDTGFLAANASPAALAERIRSVLRMGLRPVREVAGRAWEAWRERYTLDRYQEEVGEAIARASS